MNMKIKVNTKQRDAVLYALDRSLTLGDIIYLKKKGEDVFVEEGVVGKYSKPIVNQVLRGMATEQIAAVCLGVAEIEHDPVEPVEAYKAYLEGRSVYLTNKNKEMERITYSYDSILAFHPDIIQIDKNKFYIERD